MVAPPVPPQPKQDELPIETAPPMPAPQATSAAPPTTSTIPPVVPTTFEPHSPPPILLSSSRGLRCMLIRTSKVLFSAKFNST
ncbi:hypothetical protein AAG906_004863 [Vitis piasezkii]